MATNKDIIERLNCIEANVSTGQLEEIHETVKEIKEILLDESAERNTGLTDFSGISVGSGSGV